ncbi:MAG: neutral/alkaline non-lysosomal ceramidase N-terminal domain-containing protein, partial [Actinomycetes bacterium]
MSRRGDTSPLWPFLDGGAPRAAFSVRPAIPADLDHVEGVLAGAAEVDITPPPGLPKAGYSSNAFDGRGFRSRLRARVLHLRSGRSSVALVQCDLLGGSSVLQHLVAQAVATTTDVPLAGVLIGATHTHAGPGQFLGTDFYNRFASNRSGFDPAWTQFLVDQIAAGIESAVATREPCTVATGSTPVWELTRNRSLDPYVHNDTVADKRLDPQRKYVSVNPELNMIRVDTVDGRPLSTVVIFSVHGTGISQKSKEYNADLWVYLVDELAHRIASQTGVRPVVGAMEGTHADAAPAIRPGQAGPLEARRIGSAIGAAAADLWSDLGPRLANSIALATGLREVDLDRSNEVDGVQLPDRPAVGAALVAGASENTTPVIWRIPPFRAGSPRRLGRSGEHGPKWIIGSRFLQPAVLPRRGFPRILPVQTIAVGDAVIVGLPFEVTTEAGRRIADAVTAAAPTLGRPIVSSVCNEYSGYVTTPEEYQRQFYEGGHTLYGPHTLDFLAGHAASLAEAVAASSTTVVHDVAPERRWDLAVHRYLPLPAGAGPKRSFVATPSFTDPTPTEDGFWSVEWLDVAPGDLHWHEPLVTVEQRTATALSGAGVDPVGTWGATSHHGRIVSDQSSDLEVVHLGE